VVERRDEFERHEGERPGALLKEFLASLSDQARDFARRKPLESLFVAFLAGVAFSDLLRRNR
jgi:hypothetical protein